MRNLLAVPSPETDDAVVGLADWVEMSAVLARDKNASREDLTRALRRTYSISQAEAQTLAGDVFNELSDRLTSCRGTATQYPFVLDGSETLLTSRLKPGPYPRSGLLYMFLLTVTRGDMDSRHRKLDNLDPTQLFEQLCADVLLNFWGGVSDHSGAIVFGTARSQPSPKGKFQANIDNLCVNIGEGAGLRPGRKAPGGGDGKLDIVAWRRFADGRQGGLVGFGQCKTGLHWRQHLTKLQPAKFCRRYMRQPLILEPIRLYMVPHRVGREEWESHTDEGGLLFDRCRIVQYGQTIDTTISSKCRRWLNAALNKQRAGKVNP